MKINYKILFLIICIFSGTSHALWAQSSKLKKTSITITGTVKDNESKPIVNAILHANQGDIVTKTDENGVFKIQTNANSNILIEATGYESHTVSSISANQDILLNKTPYLNGKKDVISMGFKDVKKRISVGNVTKIDVSEILMHDNVTRFQSLLDNYGAGIRGGINILGYGDALIIVDGLPRDAANLQPEEIEDITILKDVNSTLLYGSQAKNGVILVKTKRGIKYRGTARQLFIIFQ